MGRADMAVPEHDLEQLAGSRNIIGLGVLADEIRRGLHGLRTTFVRVAMIDPRPEEPIAFPTAAGEVRIGGIPADRGAAVERVRAVAAVCGTRPLSAFSLADLEQLAARETMTLRALLDDLRAAGLELVAEAPIDGLHNPRRSIEEVNIAGLTLARLTVHQAGAGDPVALFKSVRELQREVAVIRAFAPLPRAVNRAVPTTGFEDVMRLSLARIVVDNVPSIQVDWTLYGPKLAQVALTVGADDLDGVSPVDDMTRGPRRTALEEVRRNVRAAGQEPVERNGRFEPLETPR